MVLFLSRTTPKCVSTAYPEGVFGMPSQFTLGIEEEFQLVDRQTGQLCPHVLAILEKGTPFFGEKIKPEMLQSAVEIVTGICPDINGARRELRELRQT